MRRVVLLSLVIASVGVPLVGCSNDAEQERLTQDRIRQERHEAALIASQRERLKQLERDLRKAKREGSNASAPASDEAASDAPREASSSAPAGGGETWPAQSSAWTVVLASAPTRSAANEVAGRASAAGLGQVGVLLSNNHSSLRGGYWVAYTGVLDHTDALRRQDDARAAGFRDAYARWVSAG